MATLDPHKDTIWLKYRCCKGAQWTAVKGGFCAEPDKAQCQFSGCNTKHQARIVGETPDLDEAHNWFNNPYKE